MLGIISVFADKSHASDEKSTVRCNVCKTLITVGQTFFHCEECLYPGFDVCGSCYTPHVHDIHREYLKRGVYPEFNPYRDDIASM